MSWCGGPYAWVFGLIAKRLHCGTLTVITPDQMCLVFRGAAPGPEAVVTLHRWRTLRRLLMNGDLGFGEAYIDGDWSTPRPGGNAGTPGFAI